MPSASMVAAPVEVGELPAGQAQPEITVVGYLVWDDNGARLCEVLMESFPPQCGGAAVPIANPAAADVELEEEQSTRWTADRVRLIGTFDGTQLILQN